MPGLHFEEFEIGHVFHHTLTRTVTEMDNMLFSNMTLNPQPLHIDFDFASKKEWGQPLVNSLFTLGLMIALTRNMRDGDTHMRTGTYAGWRARFYGNQRPWYFLNVRVFRTGLFRRDPGSRLGYSTFWTIDRYAH